MPVLLLLSAVFGKYSATLHTHHRKETSAARHRFISGGRSVSDCHFV